ncbi:hypothetical protein [Pedobacter duraquae]|uniref:Uncharacterized protein n=1 Tax=Pedobacter duraquae TaxID=425511 RepID=A0A4R6INW4_9SPHI|nr:hypothetical protein [Pedobacter duraquae]TDO23959.1 hypothetical protein CLV32_0246 [Pedobacter duraquae]
MENEQKSPYVQFSAEILDNWKENGVTYIKLIELETDLPVKFFELIPDSIVMDSDETIYPIDSEDISELLEPVAKVNFLVHEIYLEED